MSRTCPKCRHENSDDQATCAQCSWPLDKPFLRPPQTGPSADQAQAQPTEERLLWAGRPSYLAKLGQWILYALLAIAVVVLLMLIDRRRHPGLAHFLGVAAWIVILLPGIWLLASTFYLRWSTGYRLTEERLFVERGLLSRVTDQTELIRVDDVRVRQRFVHRLLGIGDVIIMSTDATDRELVVGPVADPAAVAEHVRGRMRHLRKQGLYVESL